MRESYRSLRDPAPDLEMAHAACRNRYRDYITGAQPQVDKLEVAIYHREIGVSDRFETEEARGEQPAATFTGAVGRT